MIKEIVKKSICEILDEDIDIKHGDFLRSMMDSMHILEVLLLLEENGLDTKFIQIDKLQTVKDLMQQVKKYNIKRCK